MTNEEAIYELKNAAWLGTDHSRARTEEAVDMAIQALEKENIYDDKEHYVTISKALYDKLNIDYEALLQEPTFDDECQKDMDEAWEQIQKKRKRIPVTLDLTPCDDAVSRQAVLEKQYRIDDSATLSTRDVVNVDDIEELPSVNPQEPKTGHREYNDIYDHYLCGNCKTVVMDYDNYCPNCGADMRGTENV